jgi:GT2 family glycosyltransferase
MTSFYFIAVNYNSADFTKYYIESILALKKTTEEHIEVVIVDNDSNNSDKSKLALLEEENNNVRIIWSQENLGYFRGLNRGIESIERNYDSIFVVGNNDLTFEEDFICNFLKIKYSEDILVIAPNIITKEGRQQNPHVVKEVSKTEKMKVSIYYSNYYLGQALRLVNQIMKSLRNKPVPLKNNFGQMKIKRGFGACYILTPNFFKYYDKLDDRVFMWGEEALLSNQVESVGCATLYDPEIKVIHHESASVQSIQSKKKYYITKESYKIYKKYL